MVIFVIRSFKFFATSQAIVPTLWSGRKVRTAQSNAPREQRGFRHKRKQIVPQKITARKGQGENVR